MNPPPVPASSPASAGLPPGLVSGSLLVFVGLLARTGLLMLFELIAARSLGPADYGVFSLAFTLVVVLAALSVLGFHNSVRRFISYHAARGEREDVRGLVAFGMVWPAVSGAVVGGALWAAAPWVTTELFGKPATLPVLRALAWVVPLWSTRRLATMIFSGFRKPLYKVAVEDLLEPGLRVLAAGAVASAGWGVVALAHGNLIGFGLVVLVAWWLVLRATRVRVGSGPLRWPGRELLGFSAPLVVSDLANIVLTWANILMLGLLSVQTQVGIYRAVSQPPMLASAILTSFNFIFLPVATELFVRNDFSGWNRANSSIARASLSLAFPIGAACILFPTELIGLLFGQNYVVGATAMQLLGTAYLFHAACGFTGLNLIIAGRTGSQMMATLAALVTNIGLSIYWIPRYGATGAAGAVLAATVLRNVINLVSMRARLELSPFDRRYFGLFGTHLLSAALLAGAARLADIPGVAKMLLFGSLQLPIALGLGYLLGLFDASDLDLIARYREAKGRRHGN